MSVVQCPKVTDQIQNMSVVTHCHDKTVTSRKQIHSNHNVNVALKLSTAQKKDLARNVLNSTQDHVHVYYLQQKMKSRS